MAERITVVVPYFQRDRRVLDAVRSVIRQRWPQLRVLVMSDGDPGVPTHKLTAMGGGRVLVHTLRQNNGHFFVREVARRALDDGWIAFLDADDLVHRDWLADLYAVAHSHEGVAYCAVRHFRSFGPLRRTTKIRPGRLDRAGLPEQFDYAHHNGLYRTERIDAVLGYDASFRIAYDSTFINLIAMTGRVGVVEQARYLYRRADYFAKNAPLTAHPSTGMGSAARSEAAARGLEIYRSVRIAVETRAVSVREAVAVHRDHAVEAAVDEAAESLRERLRATRWV